ncbi:MAG: NAD(P)/FAD-dependent oxidoreductase [Chlorobium sp.]|nr:NAD(P)/FAD-dependent oxidoreductase [Chlorobium sp.]
MKTAIIIGAGPAGLTAAYELLEKTEIKPIIFENASDVGGISKTINFKGNYIDIGGHRFFSKSDWVMQWWNDMIPIQTGTENMAEDLPTGTVEAKADFSDVNKTDLVMLIRNRLSRIFYLRCFFDYPISVSFKTVMNLGTIRMTRIIFSYLYSSIFPRRHEKTLEDFMINRFGNELYTIFFKDYTEKVWGTKCSDISAEWGAQRIKGLSITKTIAHALKQIANPNKDINQKNTETSLIERFLYPKLGPGQMWQETARRVLSKGGELHLNSRVQSIKISNGKVHEVTVINNETQEEVKHTGDYFFSTMPIKELIASIQGDPVPSNVQETAQGLPYRDFITVGLLMKKLHVKSKDSVDAKTIVPDNWIYIQERDVKIARLQIFNNWSPYMVKDAETVWLGLEYLCNEGDGLWVKEDNEFIEFAINELVQIDFIQKEDVIDATVIRVPKTYPAYFGTYSQFYIIRQFLDTIENLYLIGRNGMHKYNNQDHSMLTAMTAVENIRQGITSKENIWSINAEQDYHEEKK